MINNYKMVKNNKQRKRIRQKNQKQKLKELDEIKDLIDKNFPDIKTKYNFNDEKKCYEPFFEHNNGFCVITFKEDSRWSDIKRNIEKIISPHLLENGKPECLVCYEKIETIVGYCNVCSFTFCRECFLRILIENQGVHICPQCRYTIDERDKYNRVRLNMFPIPIIIRFKQA